jgi:hypothetical protein
MKQAAHLFLLLIASGLLWAAGPNEPKVAPGSAEVNLGTAQPGGKPDCTAAIIGHQWPDEASDPPFAAALAPYGYPMVCTRTGSTYFWRSVTSRGEPAKKVNKSAPAAIPVSSRPALPKD